MDDGEMESEREEADEGMQTSVTSRLVSGEAKWFRRVRHSQPASSAPSRDQQRWIAVGNGRRAARRARLNSVQPRTADTMTTTDPWPQLELAQLDYSCDSAALAGLTASQLALAPFSSQCEHPPCTLTRHSTTQPMFACRSQGTTRSHRACCDCGDVAASSDAL